MLEQQRSFLRSQALLGAMTASLQRASVYCQTASESQKSAFREALRTTLRTLENSYAVPVSEDDHLNNIEFLAARMSEEHASCLVSGHLRIGIAQKALNLYLKYLWCYGFIPIPPHCPFDSRVIARLPKKDQVLWTRLDDLDSYRALVRAAKRVAGDRSLSAWELTIYQRTDPAIVANQMVTSSSPRRKAVRS